MKEFFDFLSTHWYWAVIIVVLMIAAVLMWIKAVAASQRSREFREAEIARLEKEKALRNEYRVLDESKFNTDDNEKLLCGVAVNIQMFLEKEEDMNKSFEALPEEKKAAYALNYVFEDGKDSELSKFFRANGQPLTGEAAKAVETIIGGKFAKVFMKLYNMLDDDCEDVSFDSEKIEEYDKEYAEIMASEKAVIFNRIGDFLKSGKDIFIN